MSLTSLFVPASSGSVSIEDIDIFPFKNVSELFEAILLEVKRPGQSLIGYLNVHVANQAHKEPRLKSFLQSTQFNYCDGSGILMGAKILGKSLPTRLSAADYIIDFVRFMKENNRTVYFLGGAQGVSDKMMSVLNKEVPAHTVVGHHHGFILNDAALNAQVVADINKKKPDVLIVGFGTPLQERWIEDHADALDVPVVWPLGAVMDYFTGELSRCPKIMGDAGFEWLYRLAVEPKRLFGRYVVGNPWFLSRVLKQALTQNSRKALRSSQPGC